MARKLTYEEVRGFINSHNGCKLLTTKEEYINTHQELEILCKCGDEFKVNYKRFKGQNKQQCNACGEKIRIEKCVDNLNKYGYLSPVSKPKSHEDFIKDVYEAHGDKYTILGKYTGSKDKILVRHNKCDYEWNVIPNNFTHKSSRCPKCSGNLKKTTSQFMCEVYELTKGEYVVLGEYVNAHTTILMKHSVCGHVWKVNPASFMHSGNRCPKCASSKGEKKTSLFLDDNNINYDTQFTFEDCRNELPLPFDFYLPDHNILIEYDGKQHYEPVNFGGISDDEAKLNFKKQQKHDKIKNTYCIKNNIKLVRIPYWDFDNIEQILDEVLFEKDSAYFIA